MAALQAVAGTKIYVGSSSMSPASNLSSSSFSSVVWNEIGYLNTQGPLGRERNAIQFDLVNDPIQQTVLGSETPPPIDCTFGNDPSNAGQAILVGAVDNGANYPFKITFGDGTSTPTTRLFVGVVASAREEFGTTNNTKQLACSIRRNSNMVRVAAT